MANKINQSVLDDFIVTTTNHPDFDDNKLMELFPEFDNRTDLLDAAFSYKATKAEKDFDEPTLQSKFPEFFGVQEPEQTVRQTNPSVAENPAPTTEAEYQANLQRQWAEEQQKEQNQQPKHQPQKQQPKKAKNQNKKKYRHGCEHPSASISASMPINSETDAD